MMDFDFSNYLFTVKNDNDPFEFSEEQGMSYENLYASAGMTHHSQLVNFIQDCQTYPSFGSRLVALELASNFSPSEGKSLSSQTKVGEMLDLGANQLRKYIDELLETGYWERSIHPVTQKREFRLAPSTVAVFGKWRRIDRDKENKTRWGYGVASIKSKKNMTREVNGFQGLAVERTEAKQVRDDAKAQVAKAKNYQDVLSASALVETATTAEKKSKMVVRVDRYKQSHKLTDEHLTIISSIVAHTIISNDLVGNEGSRLYGKLADAVKDNSRISNDSLVTLTETLMRLREEKLAEKTASSDVSGAEFFSLP